MPAIASGLLISRIGTAVVKVEQTPGVRTGAGESVPTQFSWSIVSPQMSEYDSLSAPGCHW